MVFQSNLFKEFVEFLNILELLQCKYSYVLFPWQMLIPFSMTGKNVGREESSMTDHTSFIFTQHSEFDYDIFFGPQNISFYKSSIFHFSLKIMLH